jgi:hypothetical protein
VLLGATWIRALHKAACTQTAVYGENDRDGYDEAGDQLYVRLAAIVFVRGAAPLPTGVTISIPAAVVRPVAPPFCSLLLEDTARDIVIVMAFLVERFRTHLARETVDDSDRRFVE